MKYLLLGMTLCTALVLDTAAMAQPATGAQPAAQPMATRPLLAPPPGRDPNESRAMMGPGTNDSKTARNPSTPRKRAMHTARRHAPPRGDMTTDQLNSQELARIQGAGMAPAAPVSAPSQALEGPKVSGGARQ